MGRQVDGMQPHPNRVIECLNAFLGVQRERALAYQRFNSGFKASLEARTLDAETKYKTLIHSLTAEFQALSQHVLALEAELRDSLRRQDCADALRAVQEGERRKLVATVGLHALQSGLAGQRFTWQRCEEAGAVGGGCGHDHGHEGGEATEDEVHGAIDESYKELEGCIRDINAALEEVMQLREDLLEVQDTGS
jgi:hypothetical protein